MSSRDNFIYLAVSLVSLLFLSALVHQFYGNTSGQLIEGATILVLLGGVWSIQRERNWFRTGLGLLAAIILLALAGLFFNLSGSHYFHTLILLCFFVLTALQAGKQVLFSGEVDRNSIVGAVCVYLLLGLIWAILYLLVRELLPGSFIGLHDGAWYNSFPDLLYFSFITIATMGYGDITPALPLARFLVYMEGIVGQFYLAILVASLIGSKFSGPQQSQSPPVAPRHSDSGDA